MAMRVARVLVLISLLAACGRPEPTPGESASASAVVTDANPSDWQLLAVYVGSIGCGYGRDPELRAAVKAMHAKLRAQAAAGDWRLSIAGVSLDSSPDSGFAYLKGLGAWNEIVVGGNWGNLGAETHIWRPADGVSSIPQIIIIERLAVSDTSRIRFGPNQVRRRYVGTENIINWIQAGAPVGRPGTAAPAS